MIGNLLCHPDNFTHVADKNFKEKVPQLKHSKLVTISLGHEYVGLNISQKSKLSAVSQKKLHRKVEIDHIPITCFAKNLSFEWSRKTSGMLRSNQLVCYSDTTRY